MSINRLLFNNKNLINFLLALFPLSLILGNLAININILLICISGLVFYGFEIFKIEEKKYHYFIYSFFIYLILITLTNNLPNLNITSPIILAEGRHFLYLEHIYKSIFFLRFLLLFLVVNKLLEKNDLNIKFFFLSCAFFGLLVAVDIIIQVTFGRNLIGLPLSKYLSFPRPSSFFGHENVAGGYLQKFSFFFIFYALYHFSKKKKEIEKYFYILILFSFFLVPIILTLNRMPIVIYLVSIFLFLIVERKFKLILISFFLFSSILFLTLKYSPSERINYEFKNFYKSSIQLLTITPKLILQGAKLDEISQDHNISGRGYLLLFNSGIQIWKKNKIFGSGLKSFRLNCSYENGQTCSTHPHNYVLEILIDTGIIGFVLIYSIFIFAVLNFFKFYNQNFSSSIKYIALPFFLIIFFEFFPVRSTGSFFTTGNSVIIFLMLAFLINIFKLNSSNKL